MLGFIDISYDMGELMTWFPNEIAGGFFFLWLIISWLVYHLLNLFKLKKWVIIFISWSIGFIVVSFLLPYRMNNFIYMRKEAQVLKINRFWGVCSEFLGNFLSVKKAVNNFEDFKINPSKYPFKDDEYTSYMDKYKDSISNSELANRLPMFYNGIKSVSSLRGLERLKSVGNRILILVGGEFECFDYDKGQTTYEVVSPDTSIVDTRNVASPVTVRIDWGENVQREIFKP